MRRVFDSLDALSAAAADAAAGTLDDAARAAGRCSFVLSGGNTPRALYRLLGSRYRDRIPWPHVHVFWSDERYVAPDDPRSNYRMARETLLDHVPCPAANVHPMPTQFADPNAAATEYEGMLRAFFAGAPPRFDLVLLGLGPEGHTASLFPGSPALDEQARWVVAVNAPAEPPQRLTLTLNTLTCATHLYMLASGEGKAEAVRNAMVPPAAGPPSPAARLERAYRATTWWLDRPAAALTA